MTSLPVLSVVIPSWNTKDHLAACLFALERADLPPAEIIVVDNASEDGSPEMVAERFPETRLVRNERNEGFAKGSNQGIRLSEGAYVLLLNSDTEVAPDAIRRLLDFLEENDAYGAAAPRLTDSDGATQRTVQAFPNLRTLFFFSTPLERWMPNSRELRRYFMRDWSQETSADVDQPPAACLLLRRAALDQVGLFDEELWLFYNDVDLSRRLGAAGWKTRYLAEAAVVHHVGASTRKFGAFVPEWQKNRLAYYRKHHGRAAGFLVKASVAFTFADWSLKQLVARVRGRDAEPVGPMARVFGRFLLS